MSVGEIRGREKTLCVCVCVCDLIDLTCIQIRSQYANFLVKIRRRAKMEKYKEWENEKEIRMLQVDTNKQKKLKI